jgi:hypothetical protein
MSPWTSDTLPADVVISAWGHQRAVSSSGGQADARRTAGRLLTSFTHRGLHRTAAALADYSP